MVKNRSIYYALFILTLVAFPWINAKWGEFTLKMALEDKEITLVGSHGSYQLRVIDNQGNLTVRRGCYGIIFDTLYLMQTHSEHLIENSDDRLNHALYDKQRLLVYKIKQSGEGQHRLLHFPLEPQLPLIDTPVVFTGKLGL
ncbi:hypothetical protein AB3A53_000410 [Vibrio vulnificus]